ncbi:hypothetical protein [Sphingobium boeckii]|uniref:Uncharacterized protein n=1 Tax=Sphingobium boeckii TaxID=1082345 RepID=A0A7W9AF80_9SPHN|nr:hypothetical protein [Sphingobium boeckii]MBB5684447.1 hypothetical protein [Sphingobium boeckii]
MTIVGNFFWRKVPEHLIAALKTGELKVYGSIIRSISTGRIAGHLQQTSALHEIGDLVRGGMSLPLQGLGLASQTATVIQNEQIKRAVAAIQELQLTNLAFGAVGIGVSVASTAILWRKIDAVERQVSSIAGTLDMILSSVEALKQDRIVDDFARLRAVVEQMNEAWILSDPARQWNDVARDAHNLSSVFERRIIAIIDTGEVDPIVAEPMLSALSLATDTRISARLASGATLAAREVASAGAETMSKFAGHFGLGTAALKRMESDAVQAGSLSWAEAFKRHETELRQLLTDQRARVTALASNGLTISEIERQGIHGRKWLEAAREEDVPFLYLNAETSSA